MAGRTPSLDKMAAEGMRFTDYYAEAVVVTNLSEKYQKMRTGENGWTVYEGGMKQLDDIVASLSTYGLDLLKQAS